MNKLKLFLIPICVAAIALTSCNSIFRDSPNDKLAENMIWSDEMMLDEYTGSWYRHMDNGFSTLVSTLIKNNGEEFEPWFGDQITVGRRDWYQAGYGEILKGSETMINGRSRLIWQTAYEQIRSVNKLLAHQSELPATIRDRIVGEAHFFRAWYYYTLLRRYGGVMLIDRVFDPLMETVKYPRASYDQMVTFITEEAEKAARLLPESHESRHIGRVTKGAAYMLKGKTYFWAAGVKFQNAEKPYLGFPDNRTDKMRELAAKAYDEVENLHVYDLMPAEGGNMRDKAMQYRNIFLTKNSVESILEVQHNDNGDYIYQFGHRLDRDAAPPSMGGTNCAYNPTQNHVDEYRMANGKMIDDPDSDYDEDNPYENRDTRFYANILYDGAEWASHVLDMHYTMADGKEVAGLDLTAYGTSTTASITRTGYYMAKFLRESQQINNDETYASSQNYIIWRYAEMLLDYAELDWHAGRTGDALARINRIRRRVGMPDLPSVTLEDIMNERRVELAFEKTTYWDLLRLGIAEETMNGEDNPLYNVKIVVRADGSKKITHSVVNGRNSSIRYFAPKQYFWPISWDDIRYHEVEQNPGWAEV
ncbi:RagB/SusD family nutrient uptake outer membrane protein [Muribaculaceae bacterium Isolate-113 (HZI)]|jgi:hypothetical protein|nr:RagB/SusD family nutrient uptake outer membrane protein [Muribaculaceae bacterium Isolate-114 (HZI)]ROT24217.1 RagB/SusD family nutrient uptake outer membrane protein [Muribaculaceae bacterium Isolate-113 (HZI)]